MRSNRGAAVRIAATYAAVAIVWILLSDSLVALLPFQLAEILQLGKGLLFVIVTGLTLYVLVTRLGDRLQEEVHHSASAERVLNQVVSTVPVGVLIVSSEGIITFMNPAAENLLGLTAQEAVGRTLEEICVLDDPNDAAGLGDLLRTGAVDGIELGRSDDGSTRAMLARAAEIDPHVPGSGWVVALADVTDAHHSTERANRLAAGYRYLTEAAIAMSRATSMQQLLESETRLAAERGGFAGAWATLRDSSGEMRDLGVIGLGYHTREVAHALAAAYDSQSNAMLSRMYAGEIYVSNDVARDSKNPWSDAARHDQFGSSAVFALTNSEGVSATLTFFARHPGFFDADQIALLRTMRSALSFAFEKIALDSMRVAAEEALAKSESAYRELFEKHPQPMWVFDRETFRFLAVNDAAVTKYGYSPIEFLAMSVDDIRPPEDVPQFRRSVAQPVARMEDAGIWTHVDEAGRAFPVHVYPHAMEWDGRPAEIVLAVEVARVE